MACSKGRVAILHADGSTECLLDIPAWDFHWMADYYFDPAVTLLGHRRGDVRRDPHVQRGAMKWLAIIALAGCGSYSTYRNTRIGFVWQLGRSWALLPEAGMAWSSTPNAMSDSSRLFHLGVAVLWTR